VEKESVEGSPQSAVAKEESWDGIITTTTDLAAGYIQMMVPHC
jgi:hypothetical protein